MALTLNSYEFARICRLLGYEPQYVLSVRMNHNDVWVTYTNGEGELVTQAHEVDQR